MEIFKYLKSKSEKEFKNHRKKVLGSTEFEIFEKYFVWVNKNDK